MKKILFFDAMVTPRIITLVYWLLLLAALITGLNTIFNGHGRLDLAHVISGVLVALAAGLGARIWCELMIVLFKINDNLQKMADNIAPATDKAQRNDEV
ncbi:membrane protein [Shewanella sp. NFH-SH190041]|uniref:DUF4282 domain-containing protein n=1 Tax=Shewanella sp. NFH-SH190041 TaxID=2950245 RepID=UPI0021C33B24|nr:DUF4282 domain-containing protein [Shewanella sp. NFH-SH190041]BDM64286.1 membrane protein [Shewanella sp. NFH-SH190041]